MKSEIAVKDGRILPLSPASVVDIPKILDLQRASTDIRTFYPITTIKS